jgi:hypothetical protein
MSVGNNIVDNGKPLNAALPRQQVSLKKKLEKKDKFGISDWMKNNLDSLEAIGRYQYYQNMALKVNYAIVSKEFNMAHYYDVSDYYDITSAIAQEFNVPYHLKHYDITGKYVNLLIGEYLKRPDVFNVRASDAESINERLEIKTDLVHAYMNQSISLRINNKLLQMGLDPNRNDFKNEEEAAQYKAEVEAKYKELTPDSIEKYMRYDFRSSAEHWATAVLSNDRQRFNFREQEKLEFFHMLVADRCFSHIYLTPTGYALEPWNPMNVFFHQAPEVRNAEEGDFVGRVLYMTKAQIIDRFGWRMQAEQIEMLYQKDDNGRQSGGVFGEFFNATMMPFPAYRDYANVTTSLGFDPFNNAPVGNLPSLQHEDLNYGFPNYQFATADICQITEGYWRSQRKLGQLAIENPETGEVELKIVDETFDPKLFGVEELFYTSFKDVEGNQMPNTIIWTWVTHIWQGVKVNANFAQSVEDRDRNAIYFDIRPCDFQFKGDYTIFQPKLPVVGGVFNNINGKSNSFVDLLKPYQIAYNAFMNLAYGLAQRNNGKIAMLDLRLLSNFKDWGGEQALEKALTIGRELGVLPLDTSLQNTGGQVQFNQMSVLDLDESEKVERLMKLAIIWEEQGAKQVGITPQRQGQTQASETATGVQQAINNSYAVTEPYFENFYNYKRRKLKSLLDVAQYCASKDRDIVLQYTTSDLGEAFIKVNGTELMLRDIGVNVNNAQETIQELELARKLAVENNTTKLPMSALVKMIGLKSVTDITKALEQAEAEQMKEVQAQREHEQQMQQQQIEAAAAEKQKDRDNAVLIAQIKAENDLNKVTLQGIANESSFDPNADLTDKLIAQRDIALKEQQANTQNYIAQQQLVNQQLESYRKGKQEKEKLDNEKKIKEYEAKNRKEVENQKLAQIQEQSRNQEKLQTEKIKADKALQADKHKAEMSLKEKDKQLKELDLQIRKLEIENSKKEMNMELKTMEKKIDLEEDMAQTKADAIKKIADAKAEEARKLAQIKAKQAEQDAKLKVEESKQQHQFKLKEAENSHKLKLKVDTAKAKQSLKDAKKPKKKD